MTQPTVIFFGPDGSRDLERIGAPKVFLRTLLFSTGKRGRMIESMHLKLTRNETVQNFNIWVYGDKDLVRGSGLFVGETGVATNHHFLTPNDGSSFSFTKGEYKIELFAKLLGEVSESLMWSDRLQIDQSDSQSLQDQSAGIYFDWGPDSKKYISYVEMRPPARSDELLRLMTSKPQNTSSREEVLGEPDANPAD